MHVRRTAATVVLSAALAMAATACTDPNTSGSSGDPEQENQTDEPSTATFDDPTS